MAAFRGERRCRFTESAQSRPSRNPEKLNWILESVLWPEKRTGPDERRVPGSEFQFRRHVYGKRKNGLAASMPRVAHRTNLEVVPTSRKREKFFPNGNCPKANRNRAAATRQLSGIPSIDKYPSAPIRLAAHVLGRANLARAAFHPVLACDLRTSSEREQCHSNSQGHRCDRRRNE